MTSASAVSGALRRVGFNPLGSGTPRSREGIRVSGSGAGRVRVVADLDSEREARDLSIAARQALIGAGFSVETVPGNPAAFYVTRSQSNAQTRELRRDRDDIKVIREDEPHA